MVRAQSIDQLYKLAVSNVLSNGSNVTARGLSFTELSFQHLILDNIRARVITNSARKISKRFMAAEFIWMMTGQGSLEMIATYNKRMMEYSDNGVYLNGAYGPRLRRWGFPRFEYDQLNGCLQRLREDLYTRQAVIVILDPALDFVEKSKDVPCNNLLQFLYRYGKLDLACYVRSNDLCLGFPYDVFHWTMLQEMFASILGVEVGSYHHFVGSLHIYDNDRDKMELCCTGQTEKFTMNPLPQMCDLSILDKLKLIELKYREQGILEIDTLPSQWSDLVLWLKR